MQVHQRAAGGAQVALPIDQSMTHEIAAVDVGQRIHPAVDARIRADGERELRDLQGDLRVVAAVAGARGVFSFTGQARARSDAERELLEAHEEAAEEAEGFEGNVS